MITVDKLLINLLNFPLESFSEVPSRDIKVLKSIGKIVQGTTFITENQSKLLLKILRENCQKFGNYSNEVKDVTDNPLWSASFRPLDKTKKIYIDENLKINVEFAFSSLFRKVITEHSRNISGFYQVSPGKLYQADLTEKNIVTLVELLRIYKFDLDEKIQNYYNIIKSWDNTTVKNQFLFENITHPTFQRMLSLELENHEKSNELLIADRSKRYQYFTSFSKNEEATLTEKIAYRQKSKVWINSSQFELTDVFKSLQELKRFPVLVVFDVANTKKVTEELEYFAESLTSCEIVDSVGIYFRLANDEQGSKFNSFIADKKYNSHLDKNTKIVGVQNGKIPKFFLKNEWKPKSIIAIGSPLRHTKTAVYANNCDLVISYTEQEPIIDTRTQWE